MRRRQIFAVSSACALLAGFAAFAGASLPVAGPQTPTPRPYPLATCPVSGEELGSMGDAVVRVYDGREVRFCCDKCVGKFEADPAKHWQKVDEEIVGAQLMHYTLAVCPVSGHEIEDREEHGAVSVVRDNRLIRLCCADCEEDLDADPQGVMAKLDTMIADEQRETYPLKECPVSGEALGSMGEPFEIVFENRLVRFCCDGCLKNFHADPHKYMAKIDKGYADAQRAAYPLSTCIVSGEELDSDAVEVVAGNRLLKFCCTKCAGKFKKEPGKYLAELRPGKG